MRACEVLDREAADNVQPRLHTVVLTERAHAVGRSLGDLELQRRVEVTGVRRPGTRSAKPTVEWRFEPGDALVLLGRPADLARAEERLLRGT
jgi:CPA2 family monovalent cation:H+ antiporter-2